MDKLLTVAEITEYLQLTRRTIYRLLESGEIPAIRLGHQWRFDKKEIDDWIHQLPKSRGKSRKLNVLVIDDEKVIIKLFQEVLKGSGYGVLSATKGTEGLRTIENSDVDLVFLDLKMPGINGAELFKRIKMVRPNLPVVIMTGYPNSDLMNQALLEGPFAIIRKPIGALEIKAAIRSFLPKVSGQERLYHDNDVLKP